MDWLTGLGVLADNFNRTNSYNDISHIREELERLNKANSKPSTNEDLSELTYILRKMAEAQGIKLESREERIQKQKEEEEREYEKALREYRERKAKEERVNDYTNSPDYIYADLYDDGNKSYGTIWGIGIALLAVAFMVFGLTKFNSYVVNKEKKEIVEEVPAINPNTLPNFGASIEEEKVAKVESKKRISKKTDNIVTKKENVETSETLKAKELIAIPEPPKEEENKSFDVVEEMPQFPGGPNALFEYLNKNLKYPIVAEENGVQGRVIVTFVVERDGSLSDVKVVKSVDPYLDREAQRLVKSMPHWIPGKQNGENVRVKYTVPVRFNLI